MGCLFATRSLRAPRLSQPPLGSACSGCISFVFDRANNQDAQRQALHTQRDIIDFRGWRSEIHVIARMAYRCHLLFALESKSASWLSELAKDGPCAFFCQFSFLLSVVQSLVQNKPSSSWTFNLYCVTVLCAFWTASTLSSSPSVISHSTTDSAVISKGRSTQQRPHTDRSFQISIHQRPEPKSVTFNIIQSLLLTL